MPPFELRIAVSNSHVHLTEADALALFGRTCFEGLAPIGHAKFDRTAETVVLEGPRGSLPEIRVLSPCTRETWVELNRTHAARLGLEPPLGEGELSGAALAIVGPLGRLQVRRNVILEERHLELTAAEAATFGVADGQLVSAEVGGPRALVFRNVRVRVLREARDGFEGCLELDRDEANAALVAPGDRARIVTGR